MERLALDEEDAFQGRQVGIAQSKDAGHLVRDVPGSEQAVCGGVDGQGGEAQRFIVEINFELIQWLGVIGKQQSTGSA